MTSTEMLPLTPMEKLRKKALDWKNSSETAGEASPISPITPEKTGRHIDPALSAFKKTPEALKLRDWVKKNYAKCKADRLTAQRRWDIHWEFYSGEHWMQFVNGTLSARQMPRYRVKATVNQLRPIIRTEVSRMTSQKPSASITPSSGSDEDIFAAQAGEQVWESFYERKNLHMVLSECALWVAITGNGFIKPFQLFDGINVGRSDNANHYLSPLLVFAQLAISFEGYIRQRIYYTSSLPPQLYVSHHL